MKYQQLGKGIVKRREQRQVALFIDGTGLDRATRRISRKVDMSALVRGVTSGTPPVVARYYTLIPYEDDSRQRAFLDAVARAGMQVIVKRLPPKGITRQVSVDPEMSADIIAFALGHDRFSDLSEYRAEEPVAQDRRPAENAGRASFRAPGMFPAGSSQVRLRVGGSILAQNMDVPSSPASPRRGGLGTGASLALAEAPSAEEALASAAIAQSEVVEPLVETVTEQNGAPEAAKQAASAIHRVVTVVCPGRDVSYSISLAKELGADTVTADFGQFNTGDVLKSAAKWIDLSDSETIWRN